MSNQRPFIPMLAPARHRRHKSNPLRHLAATVAAGRVTRRDPAPWQTGTRSAATKARRQEPVRRSRFRFGRKGAEVLAQRRADKRLTDRRGRLRVAQ